MPQIKLEFHDRGDLEIDAPTFTSEQMEEIAEYSIEVMKERLHDGINVYDDPAKPLKRRYAKEKQRLGMNPIRDLDKTGGLLASIDVTESDNEHARVGIEGSDSFRKALYNELIDPWFGASPNDAHRVAEEKVQGIFAENVRAIVPRRRRYGRRPNG